MRYVANFASGIFAWCEIGVQLINVPNANKLRIGNDFTRTQRVLSISSNTVQLQWKDKEYFLQHYNNFNCQRIVDSTVALRCCLPSVFLPLRQVLTVLVLRVQLALQAVPLSFRFP